MLYSDVMRGVLCKAFILEALVRFRISLNGNVSELLVR